jgi:formate transporter
MAAETNNIISIDALLPPEMAQKAEAIGVKKAGMPFWPQFALSILAGAFIALGAIFATTVSAGAGALPYGVARLLAGSVFTLGLILVIVGGAELFTGNNLIVMAFTNGKVTFSALMRNWVVVYLGNFVGAIGTVILMFFSGQYNFGAGAIGLSALNTANAKVNLDFVQAIALGILCNAMVCLAVWLCYSARTTVDKILAIIPPISGFVAAGFEHSIANMYFIPIGIMIKQFAPSSFWSLKAITDAGVSPDNFVNLNMSGFLVNNLLPVTIGNIIGGAVLVGLVYGFIYLRKWTK